MPTHSSQEGLPPPLRLAATIVFLGPGLVLADSITGSGGLIATTTGARAGFTLLWLIVLGSVVKIFAQVEPDREASPGLRHRRLALSLLQRPPPGQRPIQDSACVRAILRHLGLNPETIRIAPARSPRYQHHEPECDRVEMFVSAEARGKYVRAHRIGTLRR